MLHRLLQVSCKSVSQKALHLWQTLNLVTSLSKSKKFARMLPARQKYDVHVRYFTGRFNCVLLTIKHLPQFNNIGMYMHNFKGQSEA